MITLGLTGSIATGKSTVAQCFIQLGVPVFDADAFVHITLDEGGSAVQKVAEIFPQALEGKKINRKILGDIVFSDKNKLKQLENIIHPMVRRAEENFLAQSRAHNHKIVVLDIPLLYESGADTLCNYVIVTTVHDTIQQERAIARNSITEEKLQRIKNLQLDDEAKKAKADFVIDTSCSREELFERVKEIWHLSLGGRLG